MSQLTDAWFRDVGTFFDTTRKRASSLGALEKPLNMQQPPNDGDGDPAGIPPGLIQVPHAFAPAGPRSVPGVNRRTSIESVVSTTSTDLSSFRSPSPEFGAARGSRSGSLDVERFRSGSIPGGAQFEVAVPQNVPANWPWTAAQYGGQPPAPQPGPSGSGSRPPLSPTASSLSLSTLSSERTSASQPMPIDAPPLPFLRLPAPGPRPRSNSNPALPSPLWTTEPSAYSYVARQAAISRHLAAVGGRRESITSLGPQRGSPLLSRTPIPESHGESMQIDPDDQPSRSPDPPDRP